MNRHKDHRVDRISDFLIFSAWLSKTIKSKKLFGENPARAEQPENIITGPSYFMGNTYIKFV